MTKLGYQKCKLKPSKRTKNNFDDEGSDSTEEDDIFIRSACENKAQLLSDQFAKNEDATSRETFKGKFDFLIIALGAVVGLGNIWRFPYICYRNGGGVFLIPYVIMVCAFAVPYLLAESAIGQFSGMSPIILFKNICPIFKGTGYSQVFLPIFSVTTYNLLISWSVYYFINCFSTELPWNRCNQPFNTQYCVEHYVSHVDNITSIKEISTNATSESQEKFSNFTYTVSSSEEFFTRKLLAKTSGLENIGEIQWKVFGCCVFVWVFIFFVLVGGIAKTTKVVYFTAIFPYVILIALLIRGLTLDGAIDGIYFLFIPDWNKLMSFHIWTEAATQVMFSASLAASISTLASYNSFHNNFLRDGLFILAANSITSILCGIAVFSILGSMAKHLGKSVDSVATSGIGLAYIAFPEAVSIMPFPQFWSAAFFLILFLLGIDSLIAGIEVLLTGIMDRFPSTRSYKKLIVLFTCLFGILSSLPFVTGAGIYLLDLFNNYEPTWPHLTIAFIEGVIIIFTYGMKRFLKDIDCMLGSNYSHSCFKQWITLSMMLLAFSVATILLASSVKFISPPSGDYTFPKWAENIGWTIALVPLLPIPILAIHEIVNTYSCSENFREASKKLFRPTETWNNLTYFRS